MTRDVVKTTSSKVSWHALKDSEVLNRTRSCRQGLTSSEAAVRLDQYGPNLLPGKPQPGLATIFIHQFLSPLIYILIAAGLVSMAIGEWTDAGFIFAVILLNALLGTFQEWKAERGAAALQELLKITCRVRRDNQVQDLDAENLVMGDIVVLESGDRVPADVRLLDIHSLSVDESLLTGESQAVVKHVGVYPEAALLSERGNLAFAGSSVTQGRGVGVVVATAQQTEVGSIAAAVATTAVAKPPLVIRMEQFARQVSYLVVGFVVLLAVVAFSQGTPFNEVFLMAVALAVSAIPEGLPVAMTVALSIATTRMARRNVIVRKLTAVEGLGSCTCIASDKTGTLTVNRQTVRQIWLPEGLSYRVSGEGYAGAGEVSRNDGSIPQNQEMDRLRQLALAGVLCNEASLRFVFGEWLHQGDAMDVALLALAHKLGLDPEAEIDRHIVLGDIPFESEQRYAARFVREEDATCIVKGAVEQVIDFCDTMAGADGPVPIDPLEVEGETLRLGREGYRVLAIAKGPLERAVVDPLTGPEQVPPLTLLGLVAFIDPLRQDVRDAIARCRQAGVRVVMVTGDHPATALGIARELELAASEADMLSGKQLESIDLEAPEWQEAFDRIRVFARVTPLQKLMIVEALNQRGHFTAVTGDGVNDAPALRKAHIGVAMGTGTDVAKETASIIIADDNFASLVAGIEEGRFAYNNIRKVVYLLISTGGAEIVLFSLALVSGLPLPLGAVQLLWLNLVTNGIQDVALAFESGEPGVMTHKPRPTGEGLFNRLMVMQTVISGLTMGALAFSTWAWLLAQGVGVHEARNFVLLLMVLLENVHVFNCRSEQVSAFRVPLRRNPLLIGGVLIAQSLHILIMQWPFMQRILGVAPVSLSAWFSLLGLAGFLLVAMEVFKYFRRRSMHR
ncbi:MAG: HAD-IC family P-type ATPase [Deltaproteobacteria bacterium]|nr:HAD-IC family P-type ATPase [Deltaproteobacteria bacterium]